MTVRALAAAARALNLRKLLLSAVLLRHLAYDCADTQAALTAEGLVSRREPRARERERESTHARARASKVVSRARAQP